MTRTCRLAFTAAFSLTALAGPASASNCQLMIEASFTVSYTESHTPIIPVQIKGQTIYMMMDSGSDVSYLAQEAYEKLHLTGSYHDPGFQVAGLGGNTNIEAIVMQDITFGAVKLHDELLSITGQEMAEEKGGKTPVDGIMGYDMLQHFDIGLDLPDNKVTFYDPQDCASPMLPWAGDYAPVPFTRPNNGPPVVTAAIDNQSFKMTLDTGADGSMIMESALKNAGVKPEALEHGADLTANGFGDLPFGIHMAEFSSVAIGAEGFSDDWLAMGVQRNPEMDPVDDGLIGEDYFATHRVYISNGGYTAYLGVSTQ
jgi:predicted aspartyl protease